ncbi:hypothetical protein AB0903_31010 [Streptomyces sp. NPDC048389]|uniref:hypothetical protein n=1 Tax=Streptomyces sp. NPDC048389 TaxID=3154622 RepID=UPI0034548965
MAKRCPTHDVASPLVIATLETELGIDPDALTKLRSDPNVSFTDAYADPRLIDCGRSQCRDRR